MIKVFKRVFYPLLVFGFVASFCLRCSSPGRVESQVEESVVVAESSKQTEVVKADSASLLRPRSSPAVFKARTEQILKDLPTNDLIKSNRLSEDHHDTPKAITASGRLMGEVMDKMLASPENISSGLEFYSKCAGDKEVVLQVKALCLRNLRDWEARLGKTGKSKYSKDVEKLAGQIPKTRFD